MEIAWTVVGIAVPVAITLGYTFVGLAPPEFRRARICFIGAAIALGGMEIVWYTQTGYAFMWRVIVGSLICLTIGIGLPETLRWVHRREILVAPKSETPTLPPELPPSAPAKDQVTPPRKIQQLQFRFSSKAPYTVERAPTTQYQIGIYNPGPDAIGNVMVKLTDISPRPSTPMFRTNLPCQLYNSNLAIGVLLNPKEEELFVLLTTWVSGDGRLIIGDLDRKAGQYGSFSVAVDEVWRITLRISDASTEPFEAHLLMSVENGKVIIKKASK